MKVNQVAKALGVTSETIRYYTRIGLVQPLKNPSNGYKEFSDKDIWRLRLILGARKLGISVADITLILREIDNGKQTCTTLKEVIVERLHEVEKNLNELLKMKSRLSNAIDLWKEQHPEPVGNRTLCALVESISDRYPDSFDQQPT